MNPHQKMSFEETVNQEQALAGACLSLGLRQPELLLDSHRVRVTLFPEVEGPLSSVGKVPVLSAKQLNGIVRLDPFTGAGLHGTVEIDAAHLEVISPEITGPERSKILARVNGDILDVARFPKIRFELKHIEIISADLDSVVEGTLSLRGITRKVALYFRKGSSGDFHTALIIKLTDYGIKPPTAMMGALRVKDELKASIQVTFPEA